VGTHPVQRGAILALRRVALHRPVILGYHGVTDRRVSGDLHRLQVGAQRFRLHLQLMLAAGFRFVSLPVLVDRLAGGAPGTELAARGLAAVTFDDGLRNNLTVAQPILSDLSIPATVFVVSDLIGARSPWLGPDADAEMLSADDLRTLVASGWEVGAHTASHADLAQLGYDECREEISRCVAALEQQVGVRAQMLAYPFGSYGEPAIAAARAAGVRGAVTIGSGSWRPYELTRAMISAGDPLWVVLLKLTDRYEPPLASRVVRSARARSRTVRERRRRR
jgi:peptidoglycan/xylan/chitin deacetylase (PgdA/CDA1 family)